MKEKLAALSADGSISEVEFDAKVERCAEYIRRCGRSIVAFSAGVDSTCLLALAAQTLGRENVLAAVGISASLPQRELAAARRLARDIGVEMVEIVTGELTDERYAANPVDRCYFCKQDLFTRLARLATERGFAAVLSGANADDTGDFRPGMKAAAELGVHSPLLEAGLTKAEIRALSLRLNLPTWNKPAMACLASRIPYGQRISSESLGRVEQAEAALHSLGFVACRVRSHEQVARIELPGEDLARALKLRSDITAALRKAGYAYVTLDLQGLRSGSMNETLQMSGESE